MFKYLMVVALLLSGCSTTPPEIIQPISNNVVAGSYDGIVVDVTRSGLVYDSKLNVERESWTIHLTNRTLFYRCVTIVWKLMDFELVTKYPSTIYIRPKDVLHVGTMMQSVWSIDGVNVTPPPSGYIQSINITEAENKSCY